MKLLCIPLLALLLPADASADDCAACRLPVTRVTPGAPSSGALQVTRGDAVYELPLVHTAVDAGIAGLLADVAVTQTFGNPFDEPIEAVYLFPLPDDAAVDDFVLTVQDRRIVGEVHRREEARALYDAARDAGQTAALLDQERPNVFTQRVANIPPGGVISVQIGFVQVLDYEGGGYDWTFPLVVGPRYTPAGGTGMRGGDRDAVAVPFSEEPTGQTVDIVVDVDAGVPIRDLRSPSHAPKITRVSRSAAIVQAEGIAADQDFILRYDVAGQSPAAAVVTHASAQGGYALVMLQPQLDAAIDEATVAARDLVFLIDTSCSQSGQPLDSSRDLMHQVLDRMRPDDTFSVLGFSSQVQALSERPLTATRDNLRRAHAFVDALRANGGTEMLRGVQQALALPSVPGRLRTVVMTTDGYIGNEGQILEAVEQDLGNARFFTLGTGASPNRFLIDRLGVVGRGDALYLRPDEDAGPVVDRFEERFATPLLTDLRVETEGIELLDVQPAWLPDLFAGQPVVLLARFDEPGQGTVRLRGLQGYRAWTQEVAVTLPASRPENAALASAWARAQIDDWQMLQHWGGGAEGEPLAERITELALHHRLLTEYTSFVAIDERVVREGGELKTVRVPVDVPAMTAPGVFGEAEMAYNMAPTGGVLLGARGSGAGGGGYGAAGGKVARTAMPAPPAEMPAAPAKVVASDAARPATGLASPRAEPPAPASVVLGSMDASSFRSVALRAAPRFRQCYEHALKLRPGLSGRLELVFELGDDGAVEDVRVEHSSLGDDGLEACLLTVARSLRFDGGAATVRFPLLFSAQ